MRTGNGYRKRCKRYDEAGHAHYLTFSCFRNQAFLNGQRTRRWLIDAIVAARKKHPFDLWAWVIMPEHVHLLVFPHDRTRVSEILSAVKIPVAKRAGGWVRREAPEFLPRMLDVQPTGKRVVRFWQRGGGYDRNVWTAKEIREKIVYIHDNPVRRGVAAARDDWLWSSFRAWEHGVDEPIAIDRDSVPLLSDMC
jgi:putative transposase